MSHASDDVLETIQLAAGVHAVRASDGLVFLDIDRDAYFCLFDPTEPTIAAATGAAPTTARNQLLSQQLIIDGEQTPRTAPARPITLLWQECAVPDIRRPGIRDFMRFGSALVCATWRFRRLSFRQLIHHAQKDREVTPLSTHAVATSYFERLCLWLPFRIQCLFRAFFLLHFLRYYGLRADWIFGVSLFPFLAHCWLADGDTLLGERVGKVEGFATIFQVEDASA